MIAEKAEEVERKAANRKDAVRKLREWQNGATHFTALLYGLYAKADASHKVRLERGFPLEVRVYRDWYVSPNEDQFFIAELGE